MSKINSTINNIQSLDEYASLNSTIHVIHPLVKLLVTISYISLIISFPKYELAKLLPMIIYIIIIFILSEVPFASSLRKLRIVLPICVIIGIMNSIFDYKPIFMIGEIVITGGMLSGLTLFMKEICSIFACYLLISTTGIEKVCYALRCLHLPSIFITQILLTYRYITVLLFEAGQIYEAYSLRAPRQKGIHFRVWGSLLGQLLFRSIDRANELYDSMLMRGYHGEFPCFKGLKLKIWDFVYLIVWIGYFGLARYTLFFNMVGKLIG